MISHLVALSFWIAAPLAYAPQQAGSAPLEPAMERRVQKLGKELRCAVCQGLSIADSPASMARAQLDKVRELVSAGKTDDEIRSYFMARYGEWVLLNPRAEGFNWLVWLAPAALILGGFAVIFRQIRSRFPARSTALAREAGSTSAVAPSSPAAGGPDPVDEYLQMVRSELEK